MSAKTLTAIWVVLLGLALAPSAQADPLGSWSPLPSMSTPRYGAVAAALTDGRVLVAGGIDGSGNATASAEIYDPSTNTWTPTAAMGSARAFAAATPLSDDRVLVAGGDVNGSPSASAEIYDAGSGTWSAAAPMESPRAQASAVTLSDGTVWMIGGALAAPSEIYDPVTDSWSWSEWLSPPLSGGVAVPQSDDEVLMAGGYFGGNDPGLWPGWSLQDPTDVEPVDGGQSLAPPYLASAATMAGGEVLMAGGSQSESDPAGTTIAEMYNPDVSSADLSSGFQAWSTVTPMSTARYGAVAAPLPDGGVLVAGGEGDSGALASAEEFSPPTLGFSAPPEIASGAPWQEPLRVGQTLDAYSGATVLYDPDDTESFQWQRCFATCADVGAPGPGLDYMLTAADAGATIQVVETVSKGGQTATAASSQVGPVAAQGFHLESGALQDVAPELAAGRLSYLQIPVMRDDPSGPGAVSYRVWDPAGVGYPAFPPVSGTLTFTPGQQGSTIVVPMTVAGVPILPASLSVQLYDGSPLSVVDPSEETVALRDPGSSLYVRNPANPLALSTTPPAGNPLGGAKFFADYFQSIPGRTALAWAASYPSLAANVEVIAREPNTERFGAWNGLDPGEGVSSYLDRAEKDEPGTVPMLSTYRLVDGHCGDYSDPPAEQLAYHDWITGLAQGIGTHPAVLFLEMDSLITTGCLSPEGVTVRMNELRDAINVLSNDPHLVVYLDAGAADALPPRRAASLLLRAGVSKIEGFFLNSTHFDWTSKEIRYGEKISRLTGGKHFVINTAENGRGPLRPRHPAQEGNEVLCDPPGRGLGPLPTADTGYPNVDAFAWIANPGVSGGECRPGAPPSGVFWPALALQLVKHENFRVR